MSLFMIHLENLISRNTKVPYLVSLLRGEVMNVSMHFESLESNQHYHKQLNIPGVISPLQNNLWVIGYFNGIVCFAISQDTSSGRGYYRYLFWNPFIQKYFTLPQSNYDYHLVIALVFDSNVNDFKVFAARECEVELYSLRNNSWKIVPVSNPDFFYGGEYVFVNGVIYFMEKYLPRSSVFTFNMADEVFCKIMLLENLPSSNYSLWPVQYGDTSIAVATESDSGKKIELWAMQEGSLSGSWMKILDMINDDRLVADILGVWKGREVLLQNFGGQVSSLDLNLPAAEEKCCIVSRIMD